MTNEILTRIINFNLFCHFSCKYPYHYVNIGTKIEAHIVLIVAFFKYFRCSWFLKKMIRYTYKIHSVQFVRFK